MNVWHLKYFYEAAKAGNIKSAAEKFSISNSAISQAIKSLETELDLKLLIHKKRFFELTEVGKKFFDRVPHLIHELESFKEDMKNLNDDPHGTVYIGIPRSLLSLEFIDSIMRLKKNYPKLKFKIKAGITNDIKKNLIDNEIQFGIVLDDGDLDQFSTRELSKGKFMLVAKNSRAQLKEAELAVTDSKKIEVVYLMNEFQRRNYKATIEFELASWSVIKDMVKKSGLVGYVPDYIVEDEIKKKKLHVVGEGIKNFNYSMKLIWPARRQMPRAAQLLIEKILN